MEKFKFLPKHKIFQLPDKAGVYILSASDKYQKKHIFSPGSGSASDKKNEDKFLYIGKAVNIKERVKNHFQQPTYRDRLWVNKVKGMGYIKTDSEIEALLLEAKLIRKIQPKYNVLWRDDKNYFYVEVTKEYLPVVSISHQKNKGAAYIGPFVEGTALKKTLKLLRRIFPYYTVKKHPQKECTWCHLKLCPGPNPNKKDYLKNIKRLINVLEGKSKTVLKSLKKEMKKTSRTQEYEKAAKLRDQIKYLEKIISHARVLETGKEDFFQSWNNVQNNLEKILETEKRIFRIEAYDISNIQGKEATGSMVTFINGNKDKNFYRKFKIKMEAEPNDTAMIKETLSRRLKHPEWPYPDLILIDGGKPQLSAAKEAVQNHAKNYIPLVALAKKKNELFIEGRKRPILLKFLPREIFNLILQLRDEAHRFAISYHKKLRKDALLK